MGRFEELASRAAAAIGGFFGTIFGALTNHLVLLLAMGVALAFFLIQAGGTVIVWLQSNLLGASSEGLLDRLWSIAEGVALFKPLENIANTLINAIVPNIGGSSAVSGATTTTAPTTAAVNSTANAYLTHIIRFISA